MTERFPAFFQDIFVTIVKIAFHLSKVTIWGKQTRKKTYDFLFSISDNELKKIGPSSNNLNKDSQNSNLPVQA